MDDRNENLGKALYVLKVMKEIKDNPDDIVNSKYNIGEVLAEWGIDVDGKSLEQCYEGFKALVEHELSKE